MPLSPGRILIVSLLLVISGGSGQAPVAVADTTRNLSALLHIQQQHHGLPAVAAVVIDRDRIVARGMAGVRKLGQPEPVHFGDRWHLGSNTKSITATMIGVLVEQGRLSWDTTIAQALPDLVAEMRPEYRSVTIEMLLANRGGIRHEWEVPGLWDRLWQRPGSPVEERRKMAQVMLSQPPKVEPGQYFYSNTGFGIAGHIAEIVMGQPWEELVQDLVFTPLGMTSAGFGVPWEDEPPTDPWPHQQDGTPVRPGRLADNPPAIGPGATIHASIGDWAIYIMDHLKGARGLDGQLLKADTYRRLHHGRRTHPGGDAYALGWMVLDRPWAKGKGASDTGRCLHHAGSNNSWYALVWMAPERGFAVLATTNMGGDGVFKKIDAVIWTVIQDHLRRR